MKETAKNNIFCQNETNLVVPLVCHRKVKYGEMNLSVIFSLDHIREAGILDVKFWHLSVADDELKVIPPPTIINAFILVFFSTTQPIIELPVNQFSPEACMNVTRQFIQRM